MAETVVTEAKAATAATVLVAAEVPTREAAVLVAAMVVLEEAEAEAPGATADQPMASVTMAPRQA